MIHPFFSLAGALPQAGQAYQQIAETIQASTRNSAARAAK
jgi:hypothetical protein